MLKSTGRITRRLTSVKTSAEFATHPFVNVQATPTP